MSAGARQLALRAGALLLTLYPEAWRRRYLAEMRALIEDDPPGPRDLASLLSGAATAHLRPGRWRSQARGTDRMRLSVCGVFACWIALSALGASFQKETEEPAFAALAARHPVITIANDLVLAGAALGALSIAAAGLPLLWHALRRAAAGRDRRLALSLSLPLGGLTLFAGVTAVLLALPADVAAAPAIVKLLILAPWWLAGMAFAASCALAPRLVLARVQSPPAALRRASLLAPAPVVAMALVTSGLLLYGISLAALDPHLAAQSGGPMWPSTGVIVGLAGALAAVCTALAGVAAARGLHAARNLASAP